MYITKIIPIVLPTIYHKIYKTNAINKVISGTFIITSLYYNSKYQTISEKLENCHNVNRQQQIKQNKNSKIASIISFCKYILRFIQLSLIFTPCVVLLPFCLFQKSRQIWLNLFLKSIERAGIVWIKAFQYLSHRRDIIGQKMADKFQVLRQHAPLHTSQQTYKTIQRVYGKKVTEIFEQFDPKPIGSGSVSQVYKAKLNGQQVAVKVRHPGVQKNLQRDIQLMFTISKILSPISKIFKVPITTQSLKRILKQQIYFLKQKQNLDQFYKMKMDQHITFPKTYSLSTDQVLIEEFINGKTIAYYQQNKHALNKLIANMGAKAFFSMLMQHNFVHADCHAGNILVKFIDVPKSFKSYFNKYYSQLKHYFISLGIKLKLNNSYLKSLSHQNYIYQRQILGLIQKQQKEAQVTLIDVGMAIKLTPQKKRSFQNFLRQIIQGDPLQCAKWIYHISMKQNKQIEENKYNNYFQDLKTMFVKVNSTALQNLQGIVVLKQMLEVIRNHNMQIDGQISILLTNMLILQSIAKDLDPNINILRCAVPYLNYQ